MLAPVLCIIGGLTLIAAAVLSLADPSAAFTYAAIGALLSAAGFLAYRAPDER